jgi:hypothetical protein
VKTEEIKEEKKKERVDIKNMFYPDNCNSLTVGMRALIDENMYYLPIYPDLYLREPDESKAAYTAKSSTDRSDQH